MVAVCSVAPKGGNKFLLSMTGSLKYLKESCNMANTLTSLSRSTGEQHSRLHDLRFKKKKKSRNNSYVRHPICVNAAAAQHFKYCCAKV